VKRFTYSSSNWWL